MCSGAGGSADIGFEFGDPVPAIAQPRGSWVLSRTADLPMVREELRAEMGERGRATRETFALADPVERVLLAATELAGNALRHCAPPVTLQLLRSAGGWMVKVVDDEPSSSPVLPEKAGAGQGQRGLLIVDALSEATGWCGDDEQKTVWAFVPDEPPEALVRTLRPESSG